jgi:predicted DsbA family dithiol-disulfide isomerase
MAKVDIAVISDVICPWCFIGSRRLSQVLDGADGVEASVTYHPYLLDATVPPDGMDLRERLRAKYGVDPEQMFRQIEQAARDTGIPLDFSKVRRTPNTVPAHTLLRHAAQRGSQATLSDALFAAYFLDGEDIGDPAVLAAIASRFGFTEDEARQIVTSESELAATREEAAAAARAGVRGVPFFVFNNKVGFSGAQPAHVFRQALEKATAPGPQAD